MKQVRALRGETFHPRVGMAEGCVEGLPDGTLEDGKAAETEERA